MQKIKMTIPGQPIAKARPRFAKVGKFVKTYNCQETEEGRFLFDVKLAMQGLKWSMTDGPVFLSMEFVFDRPKSHYGSGRNSMLIKNNAPVFHTKKPDTDNLDKFVMDCLNGLIWVDDSQVYKKNSMKRYVGSFDEKAHINIEIISL